MPAHAQEAEGIDLDDDVIRRLTATIKVESQPVKRRTKIRSTLSTSFLERKEKAENFSYGLNLLQSLCFPRRLPNRPSIKQGTQHDLP